MDNPHENFSGGNDFDSRLNHALLDDETLFNEETLETMATHIFAAPSAALDPSKENELISRLKADFVRSNYRFWLNLLLITLLAGGAVAVYFGFRNSNAKSLVNTTVKQPAPAAVSTAKSEDEINLALPVIRQVDEAAEETAGLPLVFADTNSPRQIILPPPASSFYASGFSRFYIPEDNDLPYEEVPGLTESQKKQTAKDKLKILKEIAKRKSYALIPKGATNVDGKLTQVNSFYAKTAEVTNFEYRTFLNDLLVQGKMDEYLLARPVKGGWKAIGIPGFEDVYFEKTAYNDFPVVNITRKGAELYCQWLTAAMTEAINRKEVKWPEKGMPDFRLPSNVEWIHAARACDTTLTLPWGMLYPDSTQNRKGCFLCNFNYDLSKDKVRPQCPYYAKNKKSGKTQPVTTTAGLAIDTLLTAPVYSYNPNDKGLYCTMGNASEMVWTWQAENPSVKGMARSMGANWNSPVDQVRIESAEQYPGMTDASPMIGFRPVMVIGN